MEPSGIEPLTSTLPELSVDELSHSFITVSAYFSYAQAALPAQNALLNSHLDLVAIFTFLPLAFL